MSVRFATVHCIRSGMPWLGNAWDFCIHFDAFVLLSLLLVSSLVFSTGRNLMMTGLCLWNVFMQFMQYNVITTVGAALLGRKEKIFNSRITDFHGKNITDSRAPTPLPPRC